MGVNETNWEAKKSKSLNCSWAEELYLRQKNSRKYFLHIVNYINWRILYGMNMIVSRNGENNELCKCQLGN